MATQKQVRERGYTFMQDSYDKITQLHYNSREEKRREEKRRGFLCLRMKEMRGLYSNDGGDMNGMSFNEG